MQRKEDDYLLQQWEASRTRAFSSDQAARAIQHAWRGFRNARIYCYYRDLIQFRWGDARVKRG